MKKKKSTRASGARPSGARNRSKLDRQLTSIVDGKGRESAENLINTELRNVIDDIAEIIAKAVRKNPENPMAELGLDKASVRKLQKILKELYGYFEAISPGQKAAKRSAMRRVKAGPASINRIDACYLANAVRYWDGVSSRLATLTNAVVDGIRKNSRWDETAGSAIPSSGQRKYVPSVGRNKAGSHIREQAKVLNGKSLRDKVLNVVESRLEEWTSPGTGTFAKTAGENAIRITNAMHSSLRNTIDVALDALKTNPVITSNELHNVVYRQMFGTFGQPRAYTKVASRALVSSTLNNAIVEETQNLVDFGALDKTDFFLNRPGFVYKAVMDLRTSDICRTLNGMIIPLSDKARLYRYMPPQHPNCRSILIPNVRG